MEEEELLELSYRRPMRAYRSGCPICGVREIVDHPVGHRTYSCGYSRGVINTECKAQEELSQIDFPMYTGHLPLTYALADLKLNFIAPNL